jgi:hypothetical protein
MKKSEWIIRRIIDAVCSLASREFPFRGHDKPSTSLNTRNFAQYLNVLKNHFPLLENRLNSANVIQFKILISYWFHEMICENPDNLKILY